SRRAWTRTPQHRRWHCGPRICARSRAPPHRSRFKARATPSTWRKGPVSEKRIGILGSGLMGAKLGTIWARAGHEVVFSYARSEEKLNKLARDAQGKARAGTPSDAAQD